MQINEKLLNKNLLQIKAPSNGSTTSAFGIDAVNCNNKEVQIGNKLTLSSGGVVIGSDIKRIKITGCLLCRFNNTHTSNTLSAGLRLMKNDSAMSNMILIGIPPKTSMETAISLPSLIISVSEGDVIKLGIYSSSSYIQKTPLADSYITVETY